MSRPLTVRTAGGRRPPRRPTDLSTASSFYRSVPTHEVVLNEATAAQERAVHAPLLTLNGGAAAAFVTLLGAKGPVSLHLAWASAAVVAWMVGLLLASGAGWAAAKRQSRINKAHRLLREELELALFPGLADLVVVPESTEGRASERGKARKEADRWASRHTALWLLSTVVFGVGAVLALVAV